MTQPYKLHGFIDEPNIERGFLLPVFKNSNEFYFQSIDSNGIIQAFDKACVDSVEDLTGGEHQVGNSAVYCFRVTKGKVLSGEFEEIKGDLYQFAFMLEDSPFLKKELALFLKDKYLLSEADADIKLKLFGYKNLYNRYIDKSVKNVSREQSGERVEHSDWVYMKNFIDGDNACLEKLILKNLKLLIGIAFYYSENYDDAESVIHELKNEFKLFPERLRQELINSNREFPIDILLAKCKKMAQNIKEQHLALDGFNSRNGLSFERLINDLNEFGQGQIFSIALNYLSESEKKLFVLNLEDPSAILRIINNDRLNKEEITFDLQRIKRKLERKILYLLVQEKPNDPNKWRHVIYTLNARVK